MATPIKLTPDEKELLEPYTEEQQEKILAISKASESTVIEAIDYFDDGDWIAYTDDEADEAVTDVIMNSLWAFKTEFLCEYLHGVETESQINAIRKLQETLCEDANPILEALLRDSPHKHKPGVYTGGDVGFMCLLIDAIAADGRGHFLSSYDGNEHEVSINDTDYFVYRVN